MSKSQLLLLQLLASEFCFTRLSVSVAIFFATRFLWEQVFPNKASPSFPCHALSVLHSCQSPRSLCPYVVHFWPLFSRFMSEPIKGAFSSLLPSSEQDLWSCPGLTWQRPWDGAGTQARWPSSNALHLLASTLTLIDQSNADVDSVFSLN